MIAVAKTVRLPGGLDKRIQVIQRSTRAHGGVVNKAVVIAVAKTVVKKYLERELGHLQFGTRT